VDVRGIDLSPGMVAVARETYPELRFDVGSMTDLDLVDSALGGVVAWYSVIHIPPALRPSVFAGFHRVLKAGGHLLMAFQVGDERRHIEHAYGHPLSLDSYRMPPDGVAHLLSEAGFVLDASLVRRPEGPEKVDQAYLLAHKV
jgi:SAM-dependent methyltransferase